jgi:hypothetical protein
MDPIAEAYGILSILSLSIFVLEHISFERCIYYEIGKYPLLDSFVLNHFSILFIYVGWNNPNNLLDLST